MNEKELEFLLKSNIYVDSTPDFEKVWKNYFLKKKEGSYMSEKKGGIKLFAWLAAFSLLIVFGVVFVSKYSLVVKQNKIDKGEALIVSAVVGDVYAQKVGSSDWKKVKVEEILQMGDNIKTEKESYCEIQMVKRGIFRIEPSSQVLLATLVNNDNKVQSKFKLEKGGMALKPKKLEKGEVFEVHTESAVAAVRGTKFFVSVDENGDTKVSVAEGKVKVVPVVKSIDSAREAGKIDDKTAEVLKENVVKPVEVGAGEEVGLKKEKIEKVDNIIKEVIKEVAASEGAKPENITTKIQEKVVTEVAKKDSKAEDFTAIIVEKRQISKEAEQKLNLISEDKILEKRETSKINFSSVPDKAKVFIDGKEVGITPFEMLIQKGKKINVRIEKDGFEMFAKEYDVSADFNIEATLNQKLVEVASSSSVSSVGSEIAKIDTPKIVSGTIDWEKSITLNVNEFDYLPVLYKGKIITVSLDNVYIFDLSGTLTKKMTVKPGIQLTKVAVGGNMFVVGAEDGGLYAYDLNGKLLWKNEKVGGQKFGGHPVMYGDKIFVSSFKDGIYILSQSGEILDNIKLSAQIFASPLVIDGGKKIIYALENGNLVCYSLENKKEEWVKAYEDRIVYPLVGNDNTVVTFVRGSGVLKGYSTLDGNKKWEVNLAELQKTDIDPIVSGGNIVIAKGGESSSVVTIVSLGSGKIVNRIQINDKITQPYLSGNSLFVGTRSGKIYAYDIETKKNLWTSDTKKKSSVSVVADKEGVFGISSGAMLKVQR
ncbi:MAG: PQQ-binding-like beta-propeller repeat protein [Brevinematales bacterium]|nr:PQQ-binding-like beta-propeller repeat protein [Brevinematales bacterium]